MAPMGSKHLILGLIVAEVGRGDRHNPGMAFDELIPHTKDQAAWIFVGGARNRTALVTLKMAALAPIPRLRTTIAMAVAPGLFKNVRRAYRRS